MPSNQSSASPAFTDEAVGNACEPWPENSIRQRRRTTSGPRRGRRDDGFSGSDVMNRSEAAAGAASARQACGVDGFEAAAQTASGENEADSPGPYRQANDRWFPGGEQAAAADKESSLASDATLQTVAAADEKSCNDSKEGPEPINDDIKREMPSPEIQSAFMRYRESKLADKSLRVALALSKLTRVRLPYPRQIEAMAAIDELYLLGHETRGDPQLGLRIFNRTGTGKSTVATQYKLMRNQNDPSGVTSVVHARLGTSGSARDLYVCIMSELSDGFPSSGTEHTLRRRATRAMAEAGVKLLILDETQHSGQKTGFSREVTAELKIMLDTGHVPIVLLGTEAAIPLVGADKELSGRMFSPCRLDPLDMTVHDDLELWIGFLGALDSRMVADGIVASKAGLAAEKVAIALGEVCDGVIGQLMRVMTMALRHTVHEGRDVITLTDIGIAVDDWSLQHGFCNRNPIWDL